MRNTIKVGVYGLLLIAIVFGSIIIYINIKKPSEVYISNYKNVDRVPLEDLIGMFNENEEKANATLIDKIIEVEGVVKEVSFLNNRHTIILNKENFTQSFVICDMFPLGDYTINQFAIGDTIVLRGVCKGYLLDVIMLNCIPINEKTK